MRRNIREIAEMDIRGGGAVGQPGEREGGYRGASKSDNRYERKRKIERRFGIAKILRYRYIFAILGKCIIVIRRWIRNISNKFINVNFIFLILLFLKLILIKNEFINIINKLKINKYRK